MPRKRQATLDEMNIPRRSLNESDAVTMDPLHPTQFITHTSPDGSSKLHYNISTLVRLANEKGLFLQPPHFREPLHDDMKAQICELMKVGDPTELMDQRKLAASRADRRRRQEAEGLDAAQAILAMELDANDNEVALADAAVQLLNAAYLQKKNLYICPICFNHAQYRAYRFVEADSLAGLTDAEINADWEDRKKREAAHRMPRRMPCPLNVIDTLDVDNELPHIVFLNAATLKRHVAHCHQTYTIDTGEYQFRSGYLARFIRFHNERARTKGRYERCMQTTQQYWNADACYNKYRYNQLYERVAAAAELAAVNEGDAAEDPATVRAFAAELTNDAPHQRKQPHRAAGDLEQRTPENVRKGRGQRGKGTSGKRGRRSQNDDDDFLADDDEVEEEERQARKRRKIDKKAATTKKRTPPRGRRKQERSRSPSPSSEDEEEGDTDSTGYNSEDAEEDEAEKFLQHLQEKHGIDTGAELRERNRRKRKAEEAERKRVARHRWNEKRRQTEEQLAPQLHSSGEDSDDDDGTSDNETDTTEGSTSSGEEAASSEGDSSESSLASSASSDQLTLEQSFERSKKRGTAREKREVQRQPCKTKATFQRLTKYEQNLLDAGADRLEREEQLQRITDGDVTPSRKRSFLSKVTVGGGGFAPSADEVGHGVSKFYMAGGKQTKLDDYKSAQQPILIDDDDDDGAPVSDVSSVTSIPTSQISSDSDSEVICKELKTSKKATPAKQPGSSAKKSTEAKAASKKMVKGEEKEDDSDLYTEVDSDEWEDRFGAPFEQDMRKSAQKPTSNPTERQLLLDDGDDMDDDAALLLSTSAACKRKNA